MTAAGPHLKTVFAEALEIESPADRAAYLDRACGDDTDLRAGVERLLQAHDKAGRFLDPVGKLAPAAASLLAPTEAPGTVIGPYKLVEQIGEGGMGLVFLAEQSRPVRRLVALKVLKPGLDTRHVLVRFDAERQALALMDHPHIAQVFDAGITPAGRPYFVMELVRGVPITDFCDGHRLDPRRRLALFADVCRAVQHAHTKGIIHRDLKPSNVLVTLHDTVPVPKVIDFGIAKATGERLTDRTLVTQFSQVIGTPLYMSPEQAEMNGLDVDTRSDVYALGVLLYELLTGATPFDPARLRSAGYDETRRILREEEPPRPSRQVATLGAAAGTVAERRGVDVRRFGQLLRGELDWIVMKALEKDRNRRYESASALAADVERYLVGEAVEARPPSAAYRLRKFAGRHKAALAATGVVAAALVAATAVSTWQAAVARKAQLAAEAAQGRAATEAAIATAIKNFLQKDLLGRVNPQLPLEGGPRGNPTLNVREALDWAAANVGERFQEQPLVEAEMRLIIGNAYRGIWEPEKAIPQLQQVVSLRKAHLGPGHKDTLFGVIALETAYEEGNRLDDALALLADWRGHFAATFGTNGLDASRFAYAHARASYHVGRFDDAERSMHAALAIRRQTDPTNGGLYPLMWLSRIYIRQGKYVAAEPAAREALTIMERKETQVTAWHHCEVLTLLGGVLVGREKYAEAEPLLLKGYAGLAEVADTTPQVNWRQTEAIEWIARLYEATNQQDKARAWREKLPPGGPPVVLRP